MKDFKKYSTISPTVYADIAGKSCAMDSRITGLWSAMPRIAGPAFTVQLSPGDNLMMHSALYEAPEGSIIVAEGCEMNFAVAGGNICATAQQKGIKGFIIDGVIRDLAEIRDLKFPVYACGVFPVPGGKYKYSPLNKTIVCGGVKVNTGDMIIADEEGIIVLPLNNIEDLYAKALAKSEKDHNESLEEWQREHETRIMALINEMKDEYTKDLESRSQIII